MCQNLKHLHLKSIHLLHLTSSPTGMLWLKPFLLSQASSPIYGENDYWADGHLTEAVSLPYLFASIALNKWKKSDRVFVTDGWKTERLSFVPYAFC